MTWADFYMLCFLVGFVLSLLTLVIGVLDIHLPGLDQLHWHGWPGHGGHVDLPQAADATGGAHLSPFNFATLMAFLAWFGAVGYLLTRVYRVWFLAVLGLASLSGLGGATLVFLFLAKVLMRHDSTLHESDFHLEGLLGKVSSGIREGGTGEIIFSLEGVRQTCGARSEDGSAIPKGTEVVITRYDKGIAYVRRWEDLANESLTGDTSNQQTAGGQ